MNNKRFLSPKVALAVLALFVFPLLVVSAFVGAGNINPVMVPLKPFNPFGNGLSNQTLNTRLPNMTSFPFELPQVNIPNIFPSLPYDLFFEILLVVILVVAVVGVLMRTTLGKRSRSFNAPDEADIEEERKEVARVLDETVNRLRQGSNYRDTVLECYRQISQILEKESEIEGRLLTAREFQDVVIEKLNLDSLYLDEATALFEVARYSDLDITQKEADRAIICLTNLSNLLKLKKGSDSKGDE